LICLVIFPLNILSAQTVYDFTPILNKTSGERRLYFAKKYPFTLEAGDQIHNAEAEEFIKQYQAFAQKNGNEDIKMDANYGEIVYQIKRIAKPEQSILRTFDSIYLVAAQKNIYWLKINCKWEAGGLCFNNLQLYEKGFLYFKELEELLQSVTYKTFPDVHWMHYCISTQYMLFQDYASAIRTAKNGISKINENVAEKFLMQNNIGLAFQKQQMYDSAIFYFKEALVSNEKHNAKSSSWTCIIKGNIAECLIGQKKFNEALPYVEADLKNAEVIKDLPLAANAYMNKASILLQNNDATNANVLLQKAYQNILQSKTTIRLEKLFPIMAKCAKMQGNAALANTYLDSALFYKDSNSRVFNAMQILRSEQKIALRKEQQFSTEKKQSARERNLLVAFVVLLGGVAMAIYKLQKKKLLQAEKLKQLELAQKDAELNQASLQLQIMATKISENLRKIEAQRLADEIVNDTATENEESISKQSDTRNELLSNLQQATILTEDEWEDFKQLFDKVHVGYLMRLKEMFPSLSPAETRFMALSKLRLNNKEMGSALGISAQSVRVTWHRLRKKLNLDEQSDLDELLDRI
jgi:hypothetical protein